jgi:hypothetical protein
VLENEEVLLNQPVKPIRIKQAVIMRTPVFQAGGREYEFRFPPFVKGRLFYP